MNSCEMNRWLGRAAAIAGLVFLANAPAFGQGLVCDVDLDGDVDQLDIGLIFAARNTPATGPDDPRDADGDGFITVNDASQCVAQCTQLGCPIITPSPNTPPVADAGQDQTVTVGQTVILDGSGSFDADGDPLMFAWSFVSVPAGSAAQLSDPTAVMPTLVADVGMTAVGSES